MFVKGFRGVVRDDGEPSVIAMGIIKVDVKLKYDNCEAEK
jgi:hypothetical protein